METIQTLPLRELVASHINEMRALKDLEPLKIDDAQPMGNEGVGFDSLDLAILVATLEQVTGIDPFADDVPRFRTFGDFVALYNK